MKKIILLLTISTHLFGALSDTVHSSISTFYENKFFSNSKQKDKGDTYGVGIDIHYDNSAYKIIYENGYTNTIKPPLKENLKTDKLFLKYVYKFNDNIKMNLNYINILNDNIAITSGGKAYGVGITNNFNEKLAVNFTQFYTDYKDFNVNQSDLRIDFKTKIDGLKLKISSITKYINIDEENLNHFTKNAKNNYLTSGIKLHSHYYGYHFGVGAYFGKRAFAIMDDGFKIQHHSMEFDRTYAVGVGKIIDKFVVRVQYIYQRATELPISNKNVELQVLKLTTNYKF